MKKTIYSIWGRIPYVYKIGCIVTFLGREKYLRKKAAESLDLKKGDIVLDLACGTGLNFLYLEEIIGKQGKIVGFDYSEEMLIAAKNNADKNNWKNIELVQGDAAKLSLGYKMDGVISTLGVSAIPKHREALKRAVDILKYNKKIVILDAKLFNGVLRIFNPVIKLLYKYSANWDYTKNIIGTLEKIMGDVGVKEYNGGSIYIATGVKGKNV